ncbi:MAG TPA: SH3 domain-containing protein [Steroidobacteraceae bacterium]
MRRRSAGRRLAALLAAGLAVPAVLRAEPLYVVEQLVVGVSSSPDASGERVATLKSGDRVEVLERSGDEVHVHLANGRDGWVRASYLSADEPLRVRLAQREAEVAHLGDEVNALKAQLRSTPATGAAPLAASAVPAAATAPPAATEDPVAGASGALFSSGEERAHPAWPWTLAAALIGFGAGFGLGALMLDRHIRRKYGGLRIY